MPTGYTSKLYEDEPQTLREFILDCSRAVLPFMKESSGPPPEQVEERSYHADKLREAHERLDAARALTMGDAEAAANAEYHQETTRRNAARRENEALRSRYESMLNDVRQWNAPELAEGLKRFMIEQLVESIKYDCDGGRVPTAELLSPSAYRDKLIKKALWDVDYHSKQLGEEIERARKTNEWLDAFFAALPSE